MSVTLSPYVLLIWISTPASVLTQCTASTNLQQLTLNPNPVVYDSGIRRNTDEMDPGIIGCFGNDPATCSASGTAIGDGIHQPASLTDLSSTLAWNQDVIITAGLSPAVRVTAVNLFFYNIPSMGIGLPHEIELNWGDSNLIFTPNRLGHAVLGNSDLNQEDNTTRNVTIAAIADTNDDVTDYTALSITFRFSDANPIRWLIISEVEICTDSVNNPRQDSIPLTPQDGEVILLQSDDIRSEIELTCTVEIEGSFQWVWSGPAAVSTFQQVFANTNRTSTITLTQLSTGSAGTYECTATYDPRSVPLGMSTSAMGSRSVIVRFESPVTEAISNRTIVTTVNSSVTLSCEVYGYLPSGSQRQINWRRMNGGAISSSSPPYTLSTRNGSRQIQNGGISPIPSLVSSLTIDVMDASVADMYTCSGPSNVGTIELIVNDIGGVTTTDMTLPPSPSGPAGPGDNEANLTPIIGGAVGGIASILVIIVIAVVILLLVRGKRGLSLCNCRSHDERIYDLPADYEKPIAPPVETIPLRLEMNVNVAYEQAKSFDMNDNSAYSNVARI